MGTQVSMKSNFHAKGVRLDVYAKDKKGNAYDIEMQTNEDEGTAAAEPVLPQ